jgi:hypothetical protein
MIIDDYVPLQKKGGGVKPNSCISYNFAKKRGGGLSPHLSSDAYMYVSPDR